MFDLFHFVIFPSMVHNFLIPSIFHYFSPHNAIQILMMSIYTKLEYSETGEIGGIMEGGGNSLRGEYLKKTGLSCAGYIDF